MHCSARLSRIYSSETTFAGECMCFQSTRCAYAYIIYREKKHDCYVFIVCIRHMILPSTKRIGFYTLWYGMYISFFHNRIYAHFILYNTKENYRCMFHRKWFYFKQKRFTRYSMYISFFHNRIYAHSIHTSDTRVVGGMLTQWFYTKRFDRFHLARSAWKVSIYMHG